MSEELRKISRLALVAVSVRWLARLLHPNMIFKVVKGVPEDAEFRYAYFDNASQCLNMVYEHPTADGFWPIEDGMVLPQIGSLGDNASIDSDCMKYGVLYSGGTDE